MQWLDDAAAAERAQCLAPERGATDVDLADHAPSDPVPVARRFFRCADDSGWADNFVHADYFGHAHDFAYEFVSQRSVEVVIAAQDLDVGITDSREAHAHQRPTGSQPRNRFGCCGENAFACDEGEHRSQRTTIGAAQYREAREVIARHFSTRAAPQQVATVRWHRGLCASVSGVLDAYQAAERMLTFALFTFSISVSPPTSMAITEIDEDLNRLERDVRQLKIEYEQYFGGGKARPPADTEWRIDLVLKRYGDRGAEMNFGQRFRYTNLAQTYARYREVFHKRVRKREEGSVDRHFGAAARAIEAERARANVNTNDNTSANANTTVAEVASPSPVAVTCSDPANEPQKLDELFTAFREALGQSGESTERLSREGFQRFLQKKAKELRDKQGSREIEFVVGVEGGKARLKARLKS